MKTPERALNTPKTSGISRIRHSRNRIVSLLTLGALALILDSDAPSRSIEDELMDSLENVFSFVEGVGNKLEELANGSDIGKIDNFDSSELVTLNESIPQGVINALHEFDPEKANMLPNVLIYFREYEDAHGAYFGKGDFDERGVFRVNKDGGGRYHLISLNPLEKFNTPLKLASVLVHEIYGHCYDDRDNELNELDELITPEDGMALNMERFRISVESEFIAFYESCRFIDWMVQSNPFSAHLPLEPLGLHDGNPDGELITDHILYQLYVDASMTDDWSDFKNVVMNMYPHLLFSSMLSSDDIDESYDFEGLIESLSVPGRPMWRSESKSLDSLELTYKLEQGRLGIEVPESDTEESIDQYDDPGQDSDEYDDFDGKDDNISLSERLREKLSERIKEYVKKKIFEKIRGK